MADRLVHAENLDKPDYSVPLSVVFCAHCYLVQIRETIPPEILFHDDYPYFSSVSPSLLKHFQDSAAAIAARRGLGPESKVIEAASNDGYMLRKFIELGIPVLGVDPPRGPFGRPRRSGRRPGKIPLPGRWPQYWWPRVRPRRTCFSPTTCWPMSPKGL